MSSLSSRSPLEQFIRAADAPGWGLAILRDGSVLATKDSGTVGFPWSVRVQVRGASYRATVHEPGDDMDSGDLILDTRGAPRASGRELREALIELTERIDQEAGPVEE